jgi:hypothetical protein
VSLFSKQVQRVCHDESEENLRSLRSLSTNPEQRLKNFRIIGL